MVSDVMLIVIAGISLFIGVALVLVVRQLAALQQGIRAATLVAAQAHTRTFDQLLVQDENLRGLMRYSRWQAATNMVLHEMEDRYQLWRAGVSDDATWQADRAYITKFAEADFVKSALQDASPELSPDFVTYLAGKSIK